MDSQTSLLSLLLLVSTVVIIYMAVQQKLFSKNNRLPPGPKPLPIIGNLFQLGDLPHQTLAGLSKIHGPLMSIKLGSITTIIASSAETAKLILHKYDHLCCSRLVPDVQRATDHDKQSIGFLPVSPEWRFLRRIWAVQVVGQKRLDAGQALRHQKVKQLLDFLSDKCRSGGSNNSIDIGEASFVTSLNLMSYTFFSMDFAQYQSNSAQEYRSIIMEVFLLAGAPNIADLFPVLKCIDPQGLRRRMEILYKKLFYTFQQIIDKRLESRTLSSQDYSACNDVLDELLNLRQVNLDEMNDNDITHFLSDVFAAGTDTTSRTMEWAMAELMHNPDKMAKAQAELEEIIGRNNFVQESDIPRLPYLQAVVKESLRLHPPAPILLPHKAETDVEMDGYIVPKGSQIFVNVWAIGRDPQTWTNPLSFEPERFLGSEVDYRGRDFGLLPFGAGRRQCPGLPLAHRMVHLSLGSLLHSFDWKLENDMKPEDMNMDEKLELSLFKAEPLKLIPVMKFVPGSMNDGQFHNIESPKQEIKLYKLETVRCSSNKP